MANIDCTVCEDLMDISPEFVSEGITKTVCTSLQNDTGLNPSLTTLHTDCEDFEVMNDCLIGRPKDELEKYEVCDWRKFMKRFIWNLHEMLGGLICAICGLWKKAHELEDRIDDLCGLLNQLMTQNMDVYGTLTGSGFDPASPRIGGEINIINGDPAVEAQVSPSTWGGVGFYYKKSNFKNCEGVTKTYEWIQPYIRDYHYTAAVSLNDCIWKVSVAQLQSWGISDYLISQLAQWPQWWGNYNRAWGVEFSSTLYMQVVNGYLEIWLIGVSETPFDGINITGMTKDPHLYIS